MAKPKPKAKAKPKAKEADPSVKGGRLPATSMAQRDEEIVAAKMRGLTWVQISRTYGISASRCKAVHANYREANPTLRHKDPVEIVDDLLEGYQASIEELALISAMSTNANARVGAINSKMVAYGKVSELLQAVGVLPHDLGHLKIEVDARFVAETVVKVMRDNGVSEEVELELARALRTGPPERGQISESN